MCEIDTDTYIYKKLPRPQVIIFGAFLLSKLPQHGCLLYRCIQFIVNLSFSFNDTFLMVHFYRTAAALR